MDRTHFHLDHVLYDSGEWSEYLNELSDNDRRKSLDCIALFFLVVRCDGSLVLRGYLHEYASFWIRSRRTKLFVASCCCYRSFLSLIDDYILLNNFLWEAFRIDFHSECKTIVAMRAFGYEMWDCVYEINKYLQPNYTFNMAYNFDIYSRN